MTSTAPGRTGTPLFAIVVGPVAAQPGAVEHSLTSVWHDAGMTVAIDANAPCIQLPGAELHVCGRIDARRDRTGRLAPGQSLRALFQELHRTRPFEEWPDELEGRFVLVLIESARHRCRLRADRFGRADIFVQRSGTNSAVAGALSLLPLPLAEDGYDQAALAHALTIYSVRPPKQHTYFKSVRRAGVGETVLISPEGIEVRRRPFTPALSAAFGDRDVDRYTDLFLEGLRARGSAGGNVVYLSSGWDSTAILAGLVHLFGAGKVRCVIGRMTYSTEAGVCNPYEIERASRVAAYYGVRLDTVEFDYTKEGEALIDELRPTFQAAGFVGPTAFNHWKLARFVADTTNGDEAAFAGEISDGAHNLGFSQFVTLFHPVLEFREYADKMQGYVFGPTFLKALWDGVALDDPVYVFLRSRYAPGTIFDELMPDRAGRSRQLLSSLFLRGVRFPLWSLANSKTLTTEGRAAYLEEMERTYLAEPAESIEPDSLYAWYLHLYHSFHWQAGTVATLDLTADRCGVPMALPFWDAGLVEFLSEMPESWGRGLEMRPTKYPLKQMLATRLDYPTHLQVGPHSYQYDVNPRFTLTGELMHRSRLGAHFKSALARGDCFAHLSPDLFALDYLHQLVDRFVSGEELFGSDLNDLANLAYFAAYDECI